MKGIFTWKLCGAILLHGSSEGEMEDEFRELGELFMGAIMVNEGLRKLKIGSLEFKHEFAPEFELEEGDEVGVNKSKVCEGTIGGFESSQVSGIAHLLIQDKIGNISRIPCVTSTTNMRLNNTFGEAYLGKTILYQLDEFGVLMWFEPNAEVA